MNKSPKNLDIPAQIAKGKNRMNMKAKQILFFYIKSQMIHIEPTQMPAIRIVKIIKGNITI